MTDIHPYSRGLTPNATNSPKGSQRPASPALPNHRLQTSDLQLPAACAEMESLFLNHLLQKMRATIEKTDLFGGGRSEELYTSMLDSEIARNLAEAGGIGLAKVLRQQLMQASASNRGDDNEE